MFKELFRQKRLKRNFFLKEIFRGNLNETISTNKIATFRFTRKISLSRKSTIKQVQKNL